MQDSRRVAGHLDGATYLDNPNLDGVQTSINQDMHELVVASLITTSEVA